MQRLVSVKLPKAVPSALRRLPYPDLVIGWVELILQSQKFPSQSENLPRLLSALADHSVKSCSLFF